MSYPQRPHGLQSSRLLRPWDFPGKSTGMGCHRLLCLSALTFQQLSLQSLEIMIKVGQRTNRILRWLLSSKHPVYKCQWLKYGYKNVFINFPHPSSQDHVYPFLWGSIMLLISLHSWQPLTGTPEATSRIFRFS